MDRGVIAAFKVYYLRQTFMELVRDFDRSGKTMKDYTSQNKFWPMRKNVCF
jgi:hypothetical protein